MSSAIVANCHRILRNIFNDVFKRCINFIFSASFIQIIHISLVVLVVMNLHSLFINVRLQCFVGIGENRKFELPAC